MPRRDIIVIGASAGGVEALQRLVSQFPATLPAAIFVVVHMAPRSKSFLPQILSRSGPLKAIHPENGTRIEPGRIYVAPPDNHLILEKEHIHLGMGPRENRHRPCINVTFRSAATAYGPRVAGVVLTGQLDDGTAGLWDIKRQGGVVIVQRPEDAAYPSMPLSALREVDVDYTLPVSEMGSLMDRLARDDGQSGTTASEMALEPKLTDITCPDCRGTIWEVRRGRHSEYRCRIGHSFSARTMLAEHFAVQEKTMWQAVVALEEGAALAGRLADDLEPNLREELLNEARLAREQAVNIRGMLTKRMTFGLDSTG
jgi:two-component system, chemotaxis family, protein-glutamate methylesterase/glutaminase